MNIAREAKLQEGGGDVIYQALVFFSSEYLWMSHLWSCFRHSFYWLLLYGMIMHITHWYIYLCKEMKQGCYDIS